MLGLSVLSRLRSPVVMKRCPLRTPCEILSPNASASLQKHSCPRARAFLVPLFDVRERLSVSQEPSLLFVFAILCFLIPAGSVFVCMLDYSDPARSRALRYSVLFLGHRFPNVRKTTAEALYLKLLANEDVVDEVWRKGESIVSKGGATGQLSMHHMLHISWQCGVTL